MRLERVHFSTEMRTKIHLQLQRKKPRTTYTDTHRIHNTKIGQKLTNKKLFHTPGDKNTTKTSIPASAAEMNTTACIRGLKDLESEEDIERNRLSLSS